MPVFPCKINGKSPACAHGFKDATTDLTQIDAWWTAGDWNIATEPERSGWAVIDIDPRSGGDAAAFCPTFTIATPSGGRHLYYSGSIKSGVGKEARNLGAGVDTRGYGGYVLLPPSYVIEERKGYQGVYTGEFPPSQWDLTELPTWIVEKLGPVVEEHRTAAANVEYDKPLALTEARRWLAQQPHPAEGAGSDDQCYRVAAKLKDFGLSREACSLLLEHWAPHFDSDWIEDKIGHAFSYGQNEHGSDVPRSGQETFGQATADIVPARPQSVRIAKGTGGRPQRVAWLWQDWLPRGMLTIFGGEKGVGKSTLTYHVLAAITAGTQWPDGSPCPIGDVLIWSAEDDWLVTILPRLMVAGANFEHVYHVEGVTMPEGGDRQFDPAIDMRGLLDAASVIPNLAAVLIDPVVSAVAGDSHKNAETRRGLQPLVDFANTRRAALIGITHFSKNTQGKSPLDRINGSLAFGAVARMVWGAVKSEDESTARRFVRVASNIGPMGGSFDYTLHQRPVPAEDFTAQALSWGAYTGGDARALINEVQGDADSKGKLQEAEEFLLMLLANGQWIEVDDIRKASTAHVIAWETLKRAKRKLGIEAKQRPGAAAAIWCWKLPLRAEPDDVEY